MERKTYYFCLAFIAYCLMLLMVPLFAHAECLDDATDPTNWGVDADASFVGIVDDPCQDLQDAGYGGFLTGRPVSGVAGGSTAYMCKGAKYIDGVWHWRYAFATAQTPDTICLGPVPPRDSDNDGLPDVQDMYPNDPNPYSVKLVTYFTDDGSASGNHVFEIWQTDRGDYYHVGEEPPEEDHSNGFYVGGDSSWIDPLDASSNADGSVTSQTQDSTIKGSGVIQPTVKTGPPTGDAPADTDPALKSGTKSTGSETDNEALKGILDNTGDVANNTKRMGEYMKSLNKAIENMDRNSIIMTSNAEQDDVEKAAQEAEAEEAKNNFKDFDVEGAIGDQINATITEGPEGDYQEHGDLADETWVQEFIDTNPISSVLDQSGFQYSSASSTANLDLGYLGSHTIDLSPLESGFIAFGNLLVALVTLTGLIHVVTGRGF